MPFRMDLRRIGHELARVLHMRVRDERVVRGLFMMAVEVRERGEFVMLGGREMIGGGFAVQLGRLM